jgi:uncharacterized membrane protein YphA (DoxX/SURF4 family)
MKAFLAWLRSPWGQRLCAWILGATFLAAAWPKIADPPGFLEAIHAYKLVPEVVAAPMALALPWLELLAALALISGFLRRSAAWVAFALLLVFMGALDIDLARGIPVDCGCFGAHPVTRSVAERLLSMRFDLARDALLALAALPLLRGPRP